ncbi:MAG TPA: nicotinate-nicotinamide nucleotide adenylyltransferase [Lacipirellulaceae bacterium]
MSTPAPSPRPPTTRLGIFGGSFDPVHCGHLELARACREEAMLDEVWFTPTAIQPLKHGGPQASDEDRIEMLRFAIESFATDSSEPGRPRSRQESGLNPQLNWRVCTLEIDRGGYSYTVDTLRQIHEELPEAKLFFLMGADALRDVPNWKEPAEIFRLATPLVVGRVGERLPELTAIQEICPAECQPLQIAMRPMDVSSSEIRRRTAAGETLDGLVPQAVADYIAAHGLYR